MVTKNEMVAILAALTTDFDKASKPREELDRETENHDKAYMLRKDSVHQEQRKSVRV
ncbi:hypothetical protein ACXYTJ_00985 [Gilvimarinus sp. F26214L]|uniref:hypothetical protein n=1 Tax=Gilvimarinus sp. DZF01 TaxID=3461371 RepID=UPI004046502C